MEEPVLLPTLLPRLRAGELIFLLSSILEAKQAPTQVT